MSSFCSSICSSVVFCILVSITFVFLFSFLCFLWNLHLELLQFSVSFLLVIFVWENTVQNVLTAYSTDRVRAPQHTDQHSTSWRSATDAILPGHREHTGGSRQDTHGTPVLTSVRRPWVAQPRPRAHASDTRRKRHAVRAARTLFTRTWLWNKGGEHRDGWQPNSLVAEQAHPQHESVRVTTTWQWSYVADQPQRGSGATMRESPEHGSGAELRTTAVTEPEHARAPITEDGSRTSPTSSLRRTWEFQSPWWLGWPTCTRRRTLTQWSSPSTDWEERGKLNCSESWCSSFQLSFGCIGLVLTKIGERLAVKTRDDCSEECTVEELDDGLSRMTVNDQQTMRARGVALNRTQFPGMTELDVVDEDDTVDDFDELDAGAAASITIVCDVLSQGSFLFSTGWCNPCAFWHTKVYQSGVGCLFCHVCPPGERKRRMQVHRRKSASADRDRQQVVKCSRDVSKHSDCLIINETVVVNAHPVQNINSEFTECSIGTDGDIPGWGQPVDAYTCWCVERSRTELAVMAKVPAIVARNCDSLWHQITDANQCRLVQHMMLYNRRWWSCLRNSKMCWQSNTLRSKECV